MLTKLNIHPDQRVRNEITTEVKNDLARITHKVVSLPIVSSSYGVSTWKNEWNLWVEGLFLTFKPSQISRLCYAIYNNLREADGTEEDS